MPKNKLSSNINSLIVNLVILFALFGIISFWLYPEYNSVKAKKEEFGKIITDYKKMEKSGVSFGKIKTNTSKLLVIENKKVKKDDILIKKLESLKNSKTIFDDLVKEKVKKPNITFLEFLEEKNKIIKTQINSKENILLEKKIENILPSYIENDENISTLTNFKFVNYLENLFFAFSLKNQGSIGIKNIVVVENLGKNKNEADQIFYIPIELKIKAKKENILNFLYYLENVGKIKVERNKQKDGIKIVFNEDKEQFFTKYDNVYKYLGNSKINNFESKTNKNSKNIYNNIFSDIKTIKFNKYIDSKLEEHKYIESLSKAKESYNEKLFINYIKDSQADETYEISLTVNFYIKGLPRYKLNEEIIKLINNFGKTIGEIEKALKKEENKKLINIDILNYSKLNSIKKLLKSKEKEITNIKKSLKEKKDLIRVYNSVKKISKQLEEAKKILEKIK